MVPVGVLCGGKGTRIAALAGDLPKALIPVSGEPFLGHQLRWLRGEGVREVILLTGHRGERIEAYAGNGQSFGLTVRYSKDGPVLRGTAGAIKRALTLLGERFVTLYGDVLLFAPVAAVAAALEPPYEGVMTVYRNEDRRMPSNVVIEDGRVLRYEKNAALGTMTHIDYGLNAFRAAAFATIPEDRPVDLAEIHSGMIARGTLRAFEVYEPYYEVGSPGGLSETERFITAGGTNEPSG